MMSEGMGYADIIILALIAGFVVLRLRATLGQKTGHMPRPFDPDAASREKEEPDMPLVQISEKSARAREKEMDTPALDSPLLEKLTDSDREAVSAIQRQDAQFTLTHFLRGAGMAFEMVLDAFQKNDRNTLKMLLSPALFDSFSAELDRRSEEPDRVQETTLLALDSSEILSVSLNKNNAVLRVRFVSEQVTVVRDKKGEIVEGDPSDAQRVQDEWTFERDITSRNPNWTVIDT